MKSRKFPAAAIKALLYLAQQPAAHLLLVAECCYLLDGSSKTPKHLHVPSTAFTVLLENGWITEPEKRGQQLAECTIADRGKAAAASLVELQSEYHQLQFDTEILDAHIKAKAASQLEFDAEILDITRANATPTPEAENPDEPEEEAVSASEQAEAIQAEAAPTPEATPEEPAQTKHRKTKEKAKAERNEKRARMQADMHQAVQSLLESLKAGKSEHLLQFLAFSAKFHNYSPLNQILIAMQAPEASHVAGYTKWKRAGYQVKKGQKGIAILAPRPYGKVTQVDEETGQEQTIGYQGVTFSIAYVFDISQLEENPDKPFPTFFTELSGDHEALYTRIAQAVRAEGIKLEIGNTGSAQGWSAGGHIRLKAGLDSTNRVLTLIHEYAHEKLHHNEAGRAMTTNKKECHAEAISYVVAAHFGIQNPYSSDYLQSWSNTEKELLAELETIKNTASAIIEAIEAQDEQEEAPASAQEALTCHYCQQPTDERTQALNGVSVCPACIAQELAASHPDELDPPTDPEPVSSTSTSPTGSMSQQTEPASQQTEQATTSVVTTEAATPETKPSLETLEASRKKRQGEKREKQGAHKISLRWASEAVTVSTEGYKKIEGLLQAYGTCHRCEQYYSQELPQAAGGLCLDCVTREYSSLTYIGKSSKDGGDGAPRYLFLDSKGAIYYSDAGPGRSERLEESQLETLKYWSFSVPASVDKNGQSIAIRNMNWSIYGDPKKNVCIARVWESYPEKFDVSFLLAKDGQVIQMNKRKASHRQLFVEARKRLVATKKDGKYHINGDSYYDINEWHEYRMICQMIDENASLWPC